MKMVFKKARCLQNWIFGAKNWVLAQCVVRRPSLTFIFLYDYFFGLFVCQTFPIIFMSRQSRKLETWKLYWLELFFHGLLSSFLCASSISAVTICGTLRECLLHVSLSCSFQSSNENVGCVNSMVCIAVLFTLKYPSAFHSHKRTQWTLIHISVHSIRRSNVIHHSITEYTLNFVIT